MEHRKAIDVLMNLRKNRSLSEEEKEAISTSIGILNWTYLAKNRLKARKAKKS